MRDVVLMMRMKATVVSFGTFGGVMTTAEAW